MNKLRFTIKILAIATFMFAFASLAQAQATRTWVSGVGDDANPCSRTAPCKTFAGAISKTADGGEIDALDPGGFGAVTITKGITIDGGTGELAGILAAGTNGVIVNETTNTKTIILRNLSINGAGTGVNGIRLLQGKTFRVENCVISGFTGNGIDAPLTAVSASGSEAFFNDLEIRNLSGAASIGIKLSAPSSFFAVGMDHVRIERVATGVQVGAQTHVTIRDSVITHNTTGVEMLNGAAGSPTSAIENTMLTNNSTGLTAGTGTTTRLSQVSIIECSTGINGAGGIVQSSGNNRILGNVSDGLTPTIVNPK